MRRWSQVCNPIDSRRFSMTVGVIERISDHVRLRVDAARESGDE